jgi:glycosyltransferase involved in cell wall biosynthesis
LIVIGLIKKGGHTEKLIRKLGLENDVTFKSNLTKNEIKDCYSKSSIAIVSSLYEGFGYPVIEAMSCEIPLIATNVSSIPELTSEFAKLVDPKNEEMIYQSVKDILSEYDKYKKIAIKGRQHVIKNFNWIKITDEYENAIFETIKNYEKC